MHMEYEGFERVAVVLQAVFATWDENMKEFTGIARDLTRKRAEKFIQIKIVAA